MWPRHDRERLSETGGTNDLTRVSVVRHMRLKSTLTIALNLI